MSRRIGFWVLVLGAVTGCSDSGGLPSGTEDALSQAACDAVPMAPDMITSVLDPSEAIADALVHSDEPTVITLAGPTSYVALEVPTQHTDYGVFVHPAGSVTATSTTALPEEHSDASCPEEALGELRLHIHEFDHSIVTLDGDTDAEVWLYFGAAGPPGHGGEGGPGGDDHGHGGEGGHGGDDHGHGGEGGHAE
jgi:hypothetical protein